MKALFPPLLSPADLPRRVLVFAPHADDEIFGCGGMLALHAARGDEVRVVILTDGAAGDPDGHERDLARVRREESRAAANVLGLGEPRFLGLPDGGLSEVPDLVQRLTAELEDFAPELVYGPSPQEMHPDHRAASRALLGALCAGPRRRVLLYGINAQVTAGALFDTTAVWELKRRAIECFESQLRYHDLLGKGAAIDRARTVNVADPAVERIEGFADLWSDRLAAYEAAVAALLDEVAGPDHGLGHGNGNGNGNGNGLGRAERVSPAPSATTSPETALPQTTAVISTWNKCEDVLANLEAVYAQSLPFAEVVVVDNASSDDTVKRISERFPTVRLIVMPHARYGACETFNIGFASVRTPLLAILDDDVVLPPDWLEKTTRRLMREPESTAIVSTKVVEPGMPESYRLSPEVNTERYMSTFRGCSSLARTHALAEAGYYDERLFIYGNERDLTCRLLNLGYRVLQYPEVETFHRTPFGIKMGKRSLYYHARNAWLGMLKYAPAKDLLRLPFLVVAKVLLRPKDKEADGTVAVAVGTIGIGRSLRETPGAWWVLCKAAASVVYNVPYCLKRREPVRAPDFELPLS